MLMAIKYLYLAFREIPHSRQTTFNVSPSRSLAINRTRSSIPEFSFPGIELPPPVMAKKYVAYVAANCIAYVLDGIKVKIIDLKVATVICRIPNVNRQ